MIVHQESQRKIYEMKKPTLSLKDATPLEEIIDSMSPNTDSVMKITLKIAEPENLLTYL